jgi:hypothetical protein
VRFDGNAATAAIDDGRERYFPVGNPRVCLFVTLEIIRESSPFARNERFATHGEPQSERQVEVGEPCRERSPYFRGGKTREK